MKIFAICLFALIPLTASAHLAPVSKGTTSTYMGNYEPVKPRSLSEIPSPVRDKVLNHLRERLGSFTDRLTFTGGEIVDFKQLARDHPDSKKYKWEVHAYDLHFAFQMPNIGIRSYTAQIQLRRDGSVLEEIDLPAFASSPEKLNFITLEKAASVAVASGFSRKDIDPKITYFKAADALVWEFEELVSDYGLVKIYKKLYVSAHNGAVLKEFLSEAVRRH